MGLDLIGLCSESIARCRTCSCKESYIKRAERTFSNVIFKSSNFATLIMYMKIPQRSVHAGCIIPVCVVCIPTSGEHSIVYIIYNTHRRGLAELFILVHRQCEGQTIGISEEVSPTSFLYP